MLPRERGWFQGLPQLRVLLLAWIAIALATQGYLVTAHTHGDAAIRAFQATAGPDLHSVSHSRRAPSDAPESCPICAEIEAVTALLPTVAVALGAPLVVAYWYSDTPFARLLARQRSHIWQSRGPPARSFLQR